MRTKRTRWMPEEFDRYALTNYSEIEINELAQAHLNHLKNAASGRMRRYYEAKKIGAQK